MWRRDMRRGTDDGTGRQSAAEGGRAWRHVLRRMFGMPDYEAYLEHCRAAGHAPTLGAGTTGRRCYMPMGKGGGAGSRMWVRVWGGGGGGVGWGGGFPHRTRRGL